MRYYDKLRRIGACQEAVKWCQDNHGTLKSAWEACEEGHWMDWLLCSIPAASHNYEALLEIENILDYMYAPLGNKKNSNKKYAKAIRKRFPNPPRI